MKTKPTEPDTTMETLLQHLLPTGVDLECSDLTINEQQITLSLHSTASTSLCPSCQQPSKQVRSRYTRTLMDLGVTTFFSGKITLRKKAYFRDWEGTNEYFYAVYSTGFVRQILPFVLEYSSENISLRKAPETE